MKNLASQVEVLEQRIAPASIVFLDIDGDTVTVTTSKGTKEQLLTAAGMTADQENTTFALQRLDLTTSAVFRGTNVTIAAAGSGNGAVNVGAIIATGIDLGTVSVDGDLGQIDAGDNKVATFGVKTLQVGSLGVESGTQGEGPDFRSSIVGGISSVESVGAIKGTLAVSGSIGRVDVGALTGGTADESGSVIAKSITTLQVDTDMTGGAGKRSGSVVTTLDIISANIGGNITGGVGEFSGTISPRDLRALTLGGSLIGGNVEGEGGKHSGEILARRNLGTADITGNVQGGAADNSGAIGAAGSVTSVRVRGDVQGGLGFESGVVGAGGLITKVTIDGDLIGDDGRKSGAVLGTFRIKQVTVVGDVIGGIGDNSGNIASDGPLDSVAVNNLVGGPGLQSGAIGSFKAVGAVVVNGDVDATSGGPLAGQIASATSIGNVTIKGDLLGGPNVQAGSIVVLGSLGTVAITGVVQGGAGETSGYITADSAGSITVGSLLGGTFQTSGTIEIRGDARTILVKGNVQGVTQNSGSILVYGNAKTIEIEGNMSGNTESNAFASGILSVGGKLDSLLIRGNLQGGAGFTSGSVSVLGSVGKIEVGGSIIGGRGNNSAAITVGSPGGEGGLPVFSNLGQLMVGDSILGGNGNRSASTTVVGVLSSVKVGTGASGQNIFNGDIEGGVGPFSASVYAGRGIGTLDVKESLRGGIGSNSGKIYSDGLISKVLIGRSIIGEGSQVTTGGYTGQIVSTVGISSVAVNLEIIGGDGAYSATIRAPYVTSVRAGIVSGEAESQFGGLRAGQGSVSASVIAYRGDIGTVSVSGAIVNGSESGSLYIAASRNIGSVAAQSIIGSDTGNLVIQAFGDPNARTVGAAVAIRSVSASIFMANTQILAGHFFVDPLFDGSGELPFNSRARIDTVTVGTLNTSDPEVVWDSNDVVAGVQTGPDGNYGTFDNLNRRADRSGIHSRIGRVVINGLLEPLSDSGTERFGIVAEEVATIIVGGANLSTLRPGVRNDTVLPVGPLTLTNTFVHETIQVEPPA